MILAWDDAQYAHIPIEANNYHWALTQMCPLFFELMPFVEYQAPVFKRNYRLDADMPGDPVETPLLVPTSPIALPAATPWNSTTKGRQALWQLTCMESPYLDDKNSALFSQIEDPRVANLKSNLRALGSLLIRRIIAATTTPPADAGGGLAANLAGWINTTPAVNQGYNALVFADYVLPYNAQMWLVDFSGGSLTVGNVSILNKAIRMIDGAPSMWIVPEAWVDAMSNSFYKRGSMIPTMIFEMAFFSQDPVKFSVYSYGGVPIVAIPNSIYDAAGHTASNPAGTNDYAIYLIKSAIADPFDGVSIVVSGSMQPDNEEEIIPGLNTLNLGTGISLERNGRVQDSTGVYRAEGRVLSMNCQCIVGDPSSCVIITGVQD